MKAADSLRTSVFIAIPVCAIVLCVLVFAGATGSAYAIWLPLSAIITTGFAFVVLQKVVFVRLETLNREIESYIHKKTTRSGQQDTEIESLERSVRRLIKEKTSEIDNLKGLERFRKEFLGNVAHELRSPIFNIQGYVYTLLEGALHDEEVNTKFLEKAARNIDHLSSLVQDLVTISMIESGEMVLEYTDFNLKDLAREVIEMQEITARQRNISLQLKTNTENGLYVRADKQKIKQVLLNLVTNSIKYGKENGHTIIQLQDMHHLASIEVSDNGEGIEEEHLPRIFERFYRTDKSRSRNQTSTGLGLSIVKHFIEAHKQKILVSSMIGVGSIFSFTLEKSRPGIELKPKN